MTCTFLCKYNEDPGIVALEEKSITIGTIQDALMSDEATLVIETVQTVGDAQALANHIIHLAKLGKHYDNHMALYMIVLVNMGLDANLVDHMMENMDFNKFPVTMDVIGKMHKQLEEERKHGR